MFAKLSMTRPRKTATRGQLPQTATNEQVSNRITDIDHAGEDCRQKLDKVKTKIEVFDEIVAQHKAQSEKKGKR